MFWWISLTTHKKSDMPKNWWCLKCSVTFSVFLDLLVDVALEHVPSADTVEALSQLSFPQGISTCPQCQNYFPIVCLPMLNWPTNSPDLNHKSLVLSRGRWIPKVKFKSKDGCSQGSLGLINIQAIPQVDCLFSTLLW